MIEVGYFHLYFLFAGPQVSTRDGHLVTRHGLTLDDSTDVTTRPEFVGRNSTKVQLQDQGLTLRNSKDLLKK